MISKTIGFRGLAYFQTHPLGVEFHSNWQIIQVPTSALFFFSTCRLSQASMRHRNWCWTPRVWHGWVSPGNCWSRPWKTVASKARIRRWLLVFYFGPLGWWDGHRYPLVMTNSLLLKITIEIVDFPIENGDFP